jgi:hypothetical protein
MLTMSAKNSFRKAATWAAVWVLFAAANAQGECGECLSTGGTVYVPAYSNIYIGSKPLAFELAAMLSIRNTDPAFPITVRSVDYLDTDGKCVRSFLSGPLELNPLASTHFLVRESDRTGGPGAKFIVRWRAGRAVNKPIIESIMTGTRSGQGISFRCPGREITEP